MRSGVGSESEVLYTPFLVLLKEYLLILSHVSDGIGSLFDRYDLYKVKKEKLR